MDRRPIAAVRRFGAFELDLDAERLLKDGRTVRLQPKPFKLLCLLTSQPGVLVTREEIQAALWPTDTFVDFEQGVNFAVKQVREALGDRAEHPLYVQTVPRRGYRFLAPVENPASPGAQPRLASDPDLEKAMWANIAELRLAEARRRRWQTMLTLAVAAMVVVVALLLLTRF
jgi:DNA-binding winged helix-turn-helix (wHTH) protein